MKVKEVQAIEVLLKAGYKVILQRKIDKLHSIGVKYSPKDLTDNRLKNVAKLGNPLDLIDKHKYDYLKTEGNKPEPDGG